MSIQERNSELVNNLTGDFVRRNDALLAAAMAIPLHLNLSVLRFFTNFAAYDGAGKAVDVSGCGSPLTASGATFFTVYGVAPIANFTGGFWFSASSGIWTTGGNFTEGCWIQPTTNLTNQRGIIGKYRDDGANERSHMIYHAAGGALIGLVSADGINNVTVTGPVLTLNKWVHVQFRFIQNSTMSLWVNGVKAAELAAGVPAGFYALGTCPFRVGSYNNTPAGFLGNIAFPYFCVSNLPDNVMWGLFEGTRAAFGI